jgi:BON domain
MARILLCVLLLSAALGFSQQLQSQDPPRTPPSNSPDNSQQPPQSATQNANQDQSQAGVNQRIQSSIQDLLSSDPILSDVDVEANVNDESIVLTGTVESYSQHQRVLQLVSSYGRWRKIDDRVKMK